MISPTLHEAVLILILNPITVGAVAVLTRPILQPILSLGLILSLDLILSLRLGLDRGALRSRAHAPGGAKPVTVTVGTITIHTRPIPQPIPCLGLTLRLIRGAPRPSTHTLPGACPNMITDQILVGTITIHTRPIPQSILRGGFISRQAQLGRKIPTSTVPHLVLILIPIPENIPGTHHSGAGNQEH